MKPLIGLGRRLVIQSESSPPLHNHV